MPALVGLPSSARALQRDDGGPRPALVRDPCRSLSSDGKALTLTAINVAFSKEVQHDTAEKAFSITPSVEGTFHWQGRTLIWTPSARLPLSTTFVVHVSPA